RPFMQTHGLLPSDHTIGASRFAAATALPGPDADPHSGCSYARPSATRPPARRVTARAQVPGLAPTPPPGDAESAAEPAAGPHRHWPGICADAAARRPDRDRPRHRPSGCASDPAAPDSVAPAGSDDQPYARRTSFRHAPDRAGSDARDRPESPASNAGHARPDRAVPPV